MLIEVKAIGLELRDAHAKQAAKPIDAELVLDLDLIALNPKNRADLESIYLLTRESMLKSGLYAYHDHLPATNKFFLEPDPPPPAPVQELT